MGLRPTILRASDQPHSSAGPRALRLTGCARSLITYVLRFRFAKQRDFVPPLKASLTSFAQRCDAMHRAGRSPAARRSLAPLIKARSLRSLSFYTGAVPFGDSISFGNAPISEGNGLFSSKIGPRGRKAPSGPGPTGLFGGAESAGLRPAGCYAAYGPIGGIRARPAPSLRALRGLRPLRLGARPGPRPQRKNPAQMKPTGLRPFGFNGRILAFGAKRMLSAGEAAGQDIGLRSNPFRE